MKKLYESQTGYVALLAILVVGAVSLAITLALLVSGTDSQHETLVTQQSSQARNLAKTCVDEALQRIFDNPPYVGTDSLTLGQGSCTFNVVNTGGGNRTIDASGTVQDVIRKIHVDITITTKINIISWQETT